MDFHLLLFENADYLSAADIKMSEILLKKILTKLYTRTAPNL